MFIPEIETMSAGEIKRFQESKLGSCLDYLARRSPYYKKLFTGEKIDISKIKFLEDLENIPTTGKETIQTDYREFLCVPQSEIVDYLTTSGTSGEPVVFGLTENDLQRLTYNEYISLLTADAAKGDTFQLMTTLDRRFMAGLAYYMGLRKIGASIIRVGSGTPEFQWDTIQRLNPNAIVVVPSFILKLIEYAEKNGIDFAASSIRKAVCIGDVIREPDFSFNELGKKITEKWNIKLYSTYASTEMATAFTECHCGRGGHLHPELIITELLGDDGRPVPDGEPGEVTITTLGVEGMPLLRYRTGDICVRHTEPCDCGRNTFRLGPVLGRKNQMLKVKGTTLYPPALYDILDCIEGISAYIVEVRRNEIGTDDITVKIAARDNSALFKADIAEHFKSKLRVTPEIVFEPYDEILKKQFPMANRKPIKFVDLR